MVLGVIRFYSCGKKGQILMYIKEKKTHQSIQSSSSYSRNIKWQWKLLKNKQKYELAVICISAIGVYILPAF